MLSINGELLAHFKQMKASLESVGADALLNVRSFLLEVRLQGRTHVFHPQFIYFDERGRRHRAFELQSNVARFGGWSPYADKQWSLASERLRFKEYAVRNRLLTPPYWSDSNIEAKDVLIKRNRRGMGGVRGPYGSSKESKLDEQGGEYYERFVWGKIVKIWFWNGNPVCGELCDFGGVRGDGRRSIRELVQRLRRRRGGKADVGTCSEFLAYQGKSLDSIPRLDEIQAVDFRRGSKLLPQAKTYIDLRHESIPGTGDQLREVGHCLWHSIPEDVRRNTIFTVDAILDVQRRLWILAMNSRPSLHPLVYQPMIESWSRESESASGQLCITHETGPAVGNAGPTVKLS